MADARLNDLTFSPAPTPVYRTQRGPSTVKSYWHRLGLRIARSAAVYGVGVCLLGGAVMAVTGVAMMFCVSPQTEVLEWTVGSIGYPVVGGCLVGMIAFVWAGAIAIPVLLATAGALRLLQAEPARDRLGMFCGAAVACLATLPISIVATLEPNPILVVVGGALMLGAIGIAQYFGATAAMATLRRRHRDPLKPLRSSAPLWRASDARDHRFARPSADGIACPRTVV